MKPITADSNNAATASDPPVQTSAVGVQHGASKVATRSDHRQRTPNQPRKAQRANAEVAWDNMLSTLLKPDAVSTAASNRLGGLIQPSDGQAESVKQSADGMVEKVEPAEDAPMPLDHFAVVETDNAKWGTAYWPIKAVGKRPLDYLARDFMHGSLLRDYRPRYFHRYAKNQPAWMTALIEHLPPAQQMAAAQHVALDFLHRRFLLKRIEAQRELGDYADERTCALLADLWCCTPHGVLVEEDQEGRRGLRYTCGHDWHCPWCLARKVVELYSFLKVHLRSVRKNRLLVLGRLHVAANPLTRPGDDLNPAESRAVRKHLGKLLHDQALDVGAVGGLLTYQLTPALPEVSVHHDAVAPGFQHELAVLGEVPLAHPDDANDVLRRLHESIHARCLGQRDGKYEWVAMPTADQNALRLLLVGSTPMYDLSRTALVPVHGELQRNMLRQKGLTGALALPALFMLDNRRWEFYRMATDGLHMFDRFGSWRGGPMMQSDYNGAFMSPADRAIHKLNDHKRVAAAGRRTSLRKLLDEYLQLPRSETGGGPGRPACRRQLATWLQDRGVPASDRDLRWLMKELAAQRLSSNSGAHE